MVLADAGEDEVLYTEDSKYAANVEKAVSLPPDAIASSFTSYEKRETPNCNTIESLAKFLKCSPTNIVKNVLYEAVYDNGKTVLVLVSIRGDQEINEVKLNNELVKIAADYQAKTLLSVTVLNDAKMLTKPLPLGYIGPYLENAYIYQVSNNWTEEDLRNKLGNQNFASDLIKNRPSKSAWTWEEVKSYAYEIRFRDQDTYQELVRLEGKQPVSQFLRLVDKTAAEINNFVTGANESNYHILGVNWGKELPTPKFELVVDVRTAKVGDRAVHDPSQTLQTARGIEAGHIFQLGTKYSQAMGATFTDEQGKEKPLVMGCYGVGVSRLAQSAVEQSYDKDGIIWPVEIAPYEVIIVIPNISDEGQVKAAEKLYQDLNNVGIEALLDDRNERAGVKFKDADLIGIPYRIVTGKSLKEGKVELVTRATKEAQTINLDEVVNTLKEWIETAKK